MNKAYKYRIYPNKEQRIQLEKTFGCVRFIYNRMLGDRISHYEDTGKSLRNTPAMYKKDYEWLKEVDSLALANAQMHLNKAYDNFFRDRKVGAPKFKSKKSNHRSYTTNMVNGNIKLSERHLKLPKLTPVMMKYHREIPEHQRIKSVTVSKTPSGKYYASILCEYTVEIIPVEPVKVIGLDFSMKELYITSEGESADYPRYYRQSLEKLKREQKRLSGCQKGSNNRKRQRLKVAKIHEKVKNQRKDFLHKKSRQIANVYDAVCIEDLNMKGMSQTLKFGKSVSDNGFGLFVEMFDYKLKEQGKTLVKVDKWYPSSKTCSHCGEVKGSLELSERTYVCPACGTEIDRDINASINIREEGIRLMSA